MTAVDQCQLSKCRPMAWGPLNKLLSPPAAGIDGTAGRVARVRRAVAGVAAELGLTNPEGTAAATAVAVSWLKSLPCQPLVVTGTTKAERVAEAAVGLGIDLSKRQWYKILEASRGAGVP